MRPKRSMTRVDEPLGLGADRRCPRRRHRPRRRHHLADPRERPLRGLGRRAVVDGHGRALGRGLDRHLGADPAAAAGDQHDPVAKRVAHQDAAGVPVRRAPGRATAAGRPVDPRMTSSVGRTSCSGSPPSRTRARVDVPEAAQLAERQPDGRERRRRHRRDRDVVEPRERHLARHVDPALGQPLQRPEREQVVGARDRRERRISGEQRVDPEGAAGPVEARAHDERSDRRRCRPRPDRAGSRPGGPARRTGRRGRPGTRSGDARARPARRSSSRSRRRCRRPRPARHRHAATGGRPPRRRPASRRDAGRSPR